MVDGAHHPPSDYSFINHSLRCHSSHLQHPVATLVLSSLFALQYLCKKKWDKISPFPHWNTHPRRGSSCKKVIRKLDQRLVNTSTSTSEKYANRKKCEWANNSAKHIATPHLPHWAHRQNMTRYNMQLSVENTFFFDDQLLNVYHVCGSFNHQTTPSKYIRHGKVTLRIRAVATQKKSQPKFLWSSLKSISLVRVERAGEWKKSASKQTNKWGKKSGK